MFLCNRNRCHFYTWRNSHFITVINMCYIMSVLSPGLSYGVDSVVDPDFSRIRIWIQPEISMHPDQKNPYSRVNGGNKVEGKKMKIFQYFAFYTSQFCSVGSRCLFRISLNCSRLLEVQKRKFRENKNYQLEYDNKISHTGI
jgi:hypothetical protein